MDKLRLIVEAIEKTRGEDLKIFDSSSINPFVDYIVICSASAYRQVYAIANNVKDILKENNILINHFEGKKDSKWILIDVDDIVVHVFLDEERNLYDLDNLYSELAQVNIDDIQ